MPSGRLMAMEKDPFFSKKSPVEMPTKKGISQPRVAKMTTGDHLEMISR